MSPSFDVAASFAHFDALEARARGSERRVRIGRRCMMTSLDVRWWVEWTGQRPCSIQHTVAQGGLTGVVLILYNGYSSAQTGA